MKKQLTLMLALGLATTGRHEAKTPSYYENIVASCKKQSQADALEALQALPVADQRIVMKMIAEGLGKNPSDFQKFLPLAINVHANDRASTRRWMVGSGVVTAAVVGLFSFLTVTNKYAPHEVLDHPEMQGLAGIVALAGLSTAGHFFSLIFRSTPNALSGFTFKQLLKAARANA